MSAIGPVRPTGLPADDAPRAPPDLRRFVIASHESAAWAARGRAFDVLWLDPLREPDVHALARLQPPTEGPPEIALPRWAVYDLAEVPGAVIGFLRTPVGSARDRAIEALSLVLATPLAEPGLWHLYGLTVRARDGPDEERCLALLTIQTAMELLDAERATLIAPWSSAIAQALPTLGTVEVLAADTPLHGSSVAATLLLYGGATPSPRPGEPVLELGPDSRHIAEQLAGVQRAIEAGGRFLLSRVGGGDASPPCLLISEVAR